VPDDATPPRAQHDPAEGRLDSWKEIAAYLRRDVKTAQRWERRDGLPVHRLHHDRLGSVYAYRHEIDAWTAGRDTPPHRSNENAPDADAAAGEPVAADDRRGRAGATQTGRRVTVALAATLATVGASWGLAHLARRSDPSPPRVAFLVEAPPGTVFAGTLIDPEPAISPDGTRIVFRAAARDTGQQLLYLRNLEVTGAEPLGGTEGAAQAFWSPDSRHVAFFAGGALKRIDLTSRLVTGIADAPYPGGGAWLPSGDILFNPDEGEGIHAVRAGGGRPIALTRVDRAAGQRRHMTPEAIPEGEGFAYLAEHADAERNAVWWWRGGGPVPDRRIVVSRRMGLFARGGWFLLFRDGRLVAQRFSSRTGALVGAPRDLGERLERDDANSRHPGCSVSSTGAITYWPASRPPRSRLTWYDRDGREAGTIGSPGDYPFVALSPDGRRAAVQRVDEVTGAPELWLHDLDTGAAVRLTASPLNDEDPVWAPGGEQIVFAHHIGIGAGAELRRVSPAHPLTAEPVATPTVYGHPTDWSRDGRRIVFQRNGPDEKSGLFAWTLPAGPETALVDSAFNERHGRLSPDGRHLAYSSDASGRLEVYVNDLAGDRATVQVSHGGGAHPRWRRDGRELFYLSAGGVLMAVPMALTPRLSAGRALPLFDARPPLPLPFLDTIYDTTPDGTRFLVAAADGPATRSFTVVINALALLAR
jgi:hypothetical protein